MKTAISKAPRIIIGIPFAIFGLFHFMEVRDMAAMLAGWLAVLGNNIAYQEKHQSIKLIKY